MITVYGEGRGFRVIWLLEELGVPYRLRGVDLAAGVESDAEFLAVNPAGFIPVLRDGDVVMVESIAIMEYLLARYGPSPLALDAGNPAFPLYKQFLLLGEAGLAGPLNTIFVSRYLVPEAERGGGVEQWALETFQSRLGIVQRQLSKTPFLAGEVFTAADISVTYALEMADRHESHVPGPLERDYVARTTARPAYQRAMAACPDTRAWVADIAARRGVNPV